MSKNKITYERPLCKVVEISVEQVIAASGIETSSNPWENNTEEEW